MNVFYFNARFVFEDQPYEERNQYGFLAAEDFIHAMKQITDYFGDDLISVSLIFVGDTCGIISTENEEVAEAFKKSYVKTHYGEDEE